MEYWVNSGLTLEEIAESFFEQQETKDKYPSGFSDEDFIIQVYYNLFGRTPDSVGFDYWLQELQSGNISRSLFILALIGGAQGDDAALLENKTTVGLAFAHDGRNSSEQAYYILKDVTADPQSVIDTLCRYQLGKCPVIPVPPRPTPPIDNPCFEFRGLEYCKVTSPYTGKIWLDRNMGAKQVCTAFDDEECYGDYYQWGRKTDGHQVFDSETNTTKATDVENAGGDFIITNSTWDWVASGVDDDGSIRSANWSKTDGEYACPAGYRVPTIDELEAEFLGYDSFLKLPSAGYRTRYDGSFHDVESWGGLWSSSDNGSYARGIGFGSGGPDWDYGDRAEGISVRCIKQGVNIALHKYVDPLTNTVAGDPQNITDGDPNNLWYSFDYNNNGEWAISFILDLGGVYTIKRYIFEILQTRRYTIESSMDGTNWTMRHIVTGLSHPSPTQDIDTSPSYQARYIKYSGYNNDNAYTGMKEFEVYGMAVAP